MGPRTTRIPEATHDRPVPPPGGSSGQGLRGRFPILPRSFVPRRQLADRLDDATQGAVTLLVAPAGAGKTLGVAGWLTARDQASSALWVSSAGELAPPDLEDLLGQVATSRQLLIVDDAHELPRATLDHIDMLLSEDPDRLHLLLLSRWDLSFSRLVPELLGDLTVLRGAVLRLERPEIEALVAHHAGTHDTEVVDAVAELAQGWCAVAVLAAKSVGAGSDPRAAAGRILQGRASATDRIMEEVYKTLTPPQQHLLLCVAAESRVTAGTAQHLSQDDGAGRTLDDLVFTGLLVTRHERLDLPGRAKADDDVTFEVHPLLREIVQRRVRSGGPDVNRARESVRSSVSNDVARGDTAAAFARLDAMGATDDVLDLLTERGVDLATAGQLDGLAGFVRRNTAALASRPLACLAVAHERWLAGDPTTARRWWERVLPTAGGVVHVDDVDAGPVLAVAGACAQAFLARTGNAGLEDAVATATATLAELPGGVQDHSLAQQLRLQTGILLLRLGRVRSAERMLSAVVGASATGEDPLTVAATAQLAVVQFVEGRERACLELAETALRDLRRIPGPLAKRTRRTVDVVRGVAAIQRLVGPEQLTISEADFDELPKVHSDDPVVDTLERLLRARALVLRGGVALAEQVLAVGLVLDDLPPPVVRLVAFDQALMALLASDWDRMARIEGLLSARGDEAEASLVAGLRADGLGDSRAAVRLYSAAMRSETPQPPTAATAMACQAQLLDAEGRSDAAMAALASAVAATRARRTALPFLGWSRHGTPVPTLLQQLAGRLDDDWQRKLSADLSTSSVGLTASASILTPTPRERAQVPEGVPRPSLSSRERDVLMGLARGSSYADIAANLFVSENTVKTHVSSLYSKLAVGRRREALAVARTLHLI
jgi:LuxR family maltose regulon positive regulatory protein